MRLLIVGTLGGQLTLASKIAMDKGASVTHAESNEQALAVLRSGRGADLLMVDVEPRHPRPGDAARRRAHPCPDRGLRRHQRRARRGQRHPCRRQGIHPAAARSRSDRGGARRRHRRPARDDLSRRCNGKCGQARPADRRLRRVRADHRRERHRQGSAGALRARALAARQEAVHHGQLRGDPGEPAGIRVVRPRERRLHRRARRAASASSRRPMAARCCSTKFPRWRCACRRNCCARSRSA